MATDQRAKARSMLQGEGYAFGGPTRPHINKKPRVSTKLKMPPAPSAVTPPAPSAPAAPQTPEFKRGGQVKKDIAMGMKKGGACYAKGGAVKPRHFAEGGAGKQRIGEASKRGCPAGEIPRFSMGGGLNIAEFKADKKSPMTAKSRFKGKIPLGNK